MTNDKELIERLALEVAGTDELTGDAIPAFAVRFIARYLAERGKDDEIAILASRDDENTSIINKSLPFGTSLFLAQQPAIPEGWIPRNPEPYLICGDVAVSNDPRYAGWVFVRHSNGKDWTTGAKLTPETWAMIAAAGSQP